MTPTKEEVRNAALELSPADRTALAEELLLSVTKEDCERIDAAWLVESRRRDTAFSSGKMTAKPSAEVVQRLQHKAGA